MTAEWLNQNGYDFDIGLGQINVKNLKMLGLKVSDLFDPCTNLQGASYILSDCYTRETEKIRDNIP